MKRLLTAATLALLMAGAQAARAAADDGGTVLTLNHYVGVHSVVPAIEGQTSEIYVRERVLAGPALRGAASSKGVVLFVHGAAIPSEVAFDVPYRDYSWMAYLARAGYDVFAMDMEGYGRSTRPAVMNDPCNVARAAQADFIPSLIPSPCEPSYPHRLTTIGSDWHDLDAVVDYLRALRHVDTVSLVAWSLGGPRAGGYAGQHPEKVNRLVLLAPAYNRNVRADAPQLPATGAAMSKQSRQDFLAVWNRQVGCANQYEPATADSVWSELLASDAVGATWGPGVSRAPGTAVWGWTPALAGRTTIPTLLVSGANDGQVPPERVRDLYADLGATSKVFVDLACSSHRAMWEVNHRLLFAASLEWLEAGTVQGQKSGMLRLGF
jgi:pimeloyl-ACP methyl ester carboxylesterase